MKRKILLSAVTVAAAVGATALPVSAKTVHHPNPHSGAAHTCPHGAHAAHGDCVSDLKSKKHK